jgi:hypothetical protein
MSELRPSSEPLDVDADAPAAAAPAAPAVAPDRTATLPGGTETLEALATRCNFKLDPSREFSSSDWGAKYFVKGQCAFSELTTNVRKQKPPDTMVPCCVCIAVVDEATGLRCGAKLNFSIYHCQSCPRHLLEVHQLKPPLAPAVKTNQPTLDTWVGRYSPMERLLRAFSKHAVPFRIMANPDFTQALNIGKPPTRKGISDALGALMNKDEAAAFEYFSSPTLCLDIGTVLGRRFVIFTLIERGYVYCAKVVSEKEMGEDRRMTIDNLRTKVKELMKYCAAHDVHIFSICADNASNMQGLPDHHLPEEVSEGDAGIGNAGRSPTCPRGHFGVPSSGC